MRSSGASHARCNGEVCCRCKKTCEGIAPRRPTSERTHMKIDFAPILRRHYDLRNSSVCPGAVAYTDTVPAHSFVSVFCPVDSLDLFLLCTARDSFNAELAKAMFGLASARRGELSVDAPVTKLDGLHVHGLAFEALLVLNWQSHHAYETLDHNLKQQTLELCPIYKCEFSGRESPKDIDTIRHHGPCTVDWNRKPSPLVYVTVRNRKTRVRMQRRYTSVAYAIHELRTLEEDGESSVVLENFLEQKIVLTKR